MIVRIIKDWDFPDILRQTPGGKGIWNGITFTTNAVKNPDVIIVLNRPPVNILSKVREGGLWLFSQESPIDLYEWHKPSFPYFDKVFTFWNDLNLTSAEVIHDQTSLPWHVNKTYDELKALIPGSEKADQVSWVTSNATAKQGHKLRLSFLKHLTDTSFPLHLYGRGFNPVSDKFDGIYPFKYSIAIENYSCNDYWTEKIADCFLSWTLPVYYGCSNILDYFPSESMLLVDPSKPEEARNKIEEAVQNNEWQKRLPAIAEARELILERYQFFPAVAEKIQKFKIAGKKRFVAIPANNKGILPAIRRLDKLKARLF